MRQSLILILYVSRIGFTMNLHLSVMQSSYVLMKQFLISTLLLLTRSIPSPFNSQLIRLIPSINTPEVLGIIRFHPGLSIMVISLIVRFRALMFVVLVLIRKSPQLYWLSPVWTIFSPERIPCPAMVILLPLVLTLAYTLAPWSM